MIWQEEKDWYLTIIDELQIVFDVGCRNDNVFYDIKPSLDIHLFDPKRPSVKMHGKFNNYALGEKQGEFKYYPEYSSMLKRDELQGEKWQHLKHNFEIIEVDTLDNYCEANGITHIDLLKIDAEGMDYAVLVGGKKMLPNIKYIQFEHWNDTSTELIRQLLKDFTIEALGGRPLNYIAYR